METINAQVSQVEKFQSIIQSEIEVFCKSLPAQPAELYDPIAYSMRIGGKRVRPLVIMLSNDLYNGDHAIGAKVAMAVEIFHNFTLVHDDIMDNAPLRRNKPTVFAKWGMNPAILSGDTMFVLAVKKLMEAGKDAAQLLDIFTTLSIKVCEGQQQDMNFETRDNVTIPEYIEMISNKTAVLLAGSMKMGALSGGATMDQANAIYDFGLNAGICFQLQDDLLDVFGDKDKFGKQVGGDIIANKKTFLYLKALELSNDEQAKELKQLYFDKSSSPELKVKAVTSIFNYLNIRSEVNKEVKRYYAKSLESLNAAGGDPSRNEYLKGFITSLMEREV